MSAAECDYADFIRRTNSVWKRDFKRTVQNVEHKKAQILQAVEAGAPSGSKGRPGGGGADGVDGADGSAGGDVGDVGGGEAKGSGAAASGGLTVEDDRMCLELLKGETELLEDCEKAIEDVARQLREAGISVELPAGGGSGPGSGGGRSRGKAASAGTGAVAQPRRLLE